MKNLQSGLISSAFMRRNEKQVRRYYWPFMCRYRRQLPRPSPLHYCKLNMNTAICRPSSVESNKRKYPFRSSGGKLNFIEQRSDRVKFTLYRSFIISGEFPGSSCRRQEQGLGGAKSNQNWLLWCFDWTYCLLNAPGSD